MAITIAIAVEESMILFLQLFIEDVYFLHK